MAIRLHRKQVLPPMRRVALGTWRTVGDPSVYSTLVLRMEKSLEQIVDDLRTRVKQIRRGQDLELEGIRRRFRHVPFLLLNRFLDLVSFRVCTLNLDLRWAGLPNDPFGTLMISNATFDDLIMDGTRARWRGCRGRRSKSHSATLT